MSAEAPHKVGVCNTDFEPATLQTCEDFKKEIQSYDWDNNVATAVMMAESRCKPKVVNWGDNHGICKGSTGLFQIGCVNAPVEEMKNPKNNIEKAYQLYKSRGWQPWGAYTNGSYKKYLK